MVDDETTIGVWIGSGEGDLVDEFDAAANSGTGTYSRSEAVKRAMRVYVGVVRALEARDVGPTEQSDQELRSLVQQAVLDHYRE